MYLGIKFGISLALIGAAAHMLWGTSETVLYTMWTGFLIGLLVGSAEIAFSHPLAGRFPYSIVLLVRTTCYFAVSLVGIYGVLLLYLNKIGMTSMALRDPLVFADISTKYFLTNVNVLYILSLTLATTVVWQLKSFFGKGVLFNYLTGRYHKPRIEERIFMFLDLNDATTLAEQLGSRRFSSLLGDFFKDIDAAITRSRGQVFQYVGDEVVVVWKPQYGLMNSNCVNAFFMAETMVERRKGYYLTKYNSVPSFKASLHLGEVTISEVGISKREIAYHGDTINTASRICSAAHVLGKRLLLSRAVRDQISQNGDIYFDDLGEHEVKGKYDRIHLYSV
ncbi:MAG: adenylate/guanylate cyclase domain-containing protein [Rhodothermales bacterium]|nr:adenylate/guanylate cyclase domain-containing protein [Rhodothermales bacterium]